MIKDYKIIDDRIYDLNEAINVIKFLISNQKIMLKEIDNLNSTVQNLSYTLDCTRDKISKLDFGLPILSL